MKGFILDCSVTMAWCFEDENQTLADMILEDLIKPEQASRAFVPFLWYLEVSNVLYTAEKKKRLSEAQSLHFLNLLDQLPIEHDISVYPSKDILLLARSYNLASYDASYLLLALRHEKPLSTFDVKLQEAARQAGIPLWNEQY